MSDDDQIYRPSAAINPERLEYLFTLAERMAKSSMVPESLRTEGPANNKTDLPFDTVVANVFAVCEQADRWNQSPFALLSCAAMVHGKLGFEGKVISAVLDTNFGVVLKHYFVGTPTSDDYRIYLCDRDLPEDILTDLTPGKRFPGYNIMDGSAAEWKTTGAGTPWRPATFGKMLVYRGTREWCRIYKPAAIMGILADDELLEISMDRRARGARDISTTSNPLLESKPSLSMERFDAETGELIEASGAQAERTDNQTSARRSGDDPRASGKPAREAGRGTDSARSEQSPTNTASSTSQADGGSAGGDGPPRRPSSVFSEFSQTLLRFSTVDSVEKGHNAFWDAHEGKPTNGADVILVKEILRIHNNRVKNSVAVEQVQKDSDAAIARSFDI